MFAFMLALAKASAQESGKTQTHPIHYELNIGTLRSTHATFFNAVSLNAGYPFSRNFTAGIGAEYAACNYHEDNDWILTNLHFIPVYAFQKIGIMHRKAFDLYANLREGISFIDYHKDEILVAPGKVYPVTENGLYVYAGAGASKKLSQRLAITADIGMKSFHLSYDELEVNPHGINFMMGVNYHFLVS